MAGSQVSSIWGPPKCALPWENLGQSMEFGGAPEGWGQWVSVQTWLVAPIHQFRVPRPPVIPVGAKPPPGGLGGDSKFASLPGMG